MKAQCRPLRQTQAGLVLGGAQQTLGGPRILQRLVVLRLRDVSVERDGELPEGESDLGKRRKRMDIR